MSPEFLALAIIILLFSVIVHEVMHGWMALRFGDTTAQRAGRLTLNPLPHIDPIGTVLLPLMLLVLPAITGVGTGFIIGWAKPVPVNPLHFKNIRKGELFVSAAGIVSNLLLALVAASLYHLTLPVVGFHLITEILKYAVSINLMLAIFNLLPIPPLDGSKILLSQLPLYLAREYEKITPYGFFIILILLYFNVIGLILRLVMPALLKLLGIPLF